MIYIYRENFRQNEDALEHLRQLFQLSFSRSQKEANSKQDFIALHLGIHETDYLINFWFNQLFFEGFNEFQSFVLFLYHKFFLKINF